MKVKSFRTNPLTRLIVLISLFILAWIAFFHHLGSMGLLDKTEPMFVEAARQMVITGDWVTPYWNDATRFDKPPLSYWLMGISMKILDINEFSARLPSAILALSLVLVLFYTLKRFFIVESQESSKSSWLWAGIGAAMMIFNPAWIAWARTGVSDMFLSSCLSIALLSFFWGYAQKSPFQWRWYVSFYVFLALAILSKGPVAIVLPAMIIICFLFYVGQWRQTLREMHLTWGLLIICLITLPWFVAITTVHGWDYINTFFGFHNFQRYTSVVSKHPGAWYYFFPVLFVGLIPWSSYLPLGIYRLKLWQRKYWMGQKRESQLGLFALFWLVIIFSFFSISATKLPSYILPSMPAGVIIISFVWRDLFGQKTSDSYPQWAFVFSSVIYILFLSTLSIISLFVPQLVGDNPLTPQLTEDLQTSGLALNGCIAWGIASLASIVLMFKPNGWRWLWITGIAGFSSFMLFFALPATEIIDTHLQLPLRQLATTVVSTRQPQEELLMVGFIRPSLVFYTQKPVNFLKTTKDFLPYLESKRQKQENFLLITDINRSKKLQLDQQYTKLIDKKGFYQLFKVDFQR